MPQRTHAEESREDQHQQTGHDETERRTQGKTGEPRDHIAPRVLVTQGLIDAGASGEQRRPQPETVTDRVEQPVQLTDQHAGEKAANQDADATLPRLTRRKPEQTGDDCQHDFLADLGERGFEDVGLGDEDVDEHHADTEERKRQHDAKSRQC